MTLAATSSAAPTTPARTASSTTRCAASTSTSTPRAACALQSPTPPATSCALSTRPARVSTGAAAPPSLECSFDAAGQLRRRAAASSGELALDWDALGRLRSTTPVDADTTRYTYDAEGRRTRKSTGARTTRFFWDGDALLADGVDSAHPREFIYHPGTFEPLAQIAADGNIYFYQNDPNGLPRALVDRTGRVVWSARYSAHGELQALDTAEIDNPLRLQGQYADPETGLHYNRFRYYDPKSASFISQDPLGLGAGQNHYALAPNVWSWADPLGLNPCRFTADQQALIDLASPYKNKGVSGDEADILLEFAEEVNLKNPSMPLKNFDHRFGPNNPFPGHYNYEGAKGHIHIHNMHIPVN